MAAVELAEVKIDAAKGDLPTAPAVTDGGGDGGGEGDMSGLSSAAAAELIEEFGRNEIPENVKAWPVQRAPRGLSRDAPVHHEQRVAGGTVASPCSARPNPSCPVRAARAPAAAPRGGAAGARTHTPRARA